VEHIKRKIVGVRLNDPDRCTISDASDMWLQYLLDMAASFAEMDPRKLPSAMRIKMLTVDTSEALVLTLQGIVSLTKSVTCTRVLYVMLGQMQSDRIEGEFGIYRQLAGGNYHISLDQVLNGLRLQKLKLFKKLSFEPSSLHSKDACRTAEFSEHELY